MTTILTWVVHLAAAGLTTFFLGIVFSLLLSATWHPETATLTTICVVAALTGAYGQGWRLWHRPYEHADLTAHDVVMTAFRWFTCPLVAAGVGGVIGIVIDLLPYQSSGGWVQISADAFPPAALLMAGVFFIIAGVPYALLRETREFFRMP